MPINRFEYINYATDTVISDLFHWRQKIEDYLIEFYNGQINNALGTTFGDCISKSSELLEYALDEPTMFRDVTNNNMLQAGTIIGYRFGEIYLYEEAQQHILIDILCSAPWNCLPESLEETKKGAASWLIADIIEETISGSSNESVILKVAAIPRAIEAYKNMGFQENLDSSREMILTEKRALQFLEEYKKLWR